jgi:threonine dehydratase
MSKINACRRYGSEIDLVKFNDETFANADSLAHGCCFIHTLEEYGLMDGHGTIGLEVLEDAPDVDTIFVPLGASFLASGISLAAKALKPGVRVVGVNAENCPHFYDSLRNGEPTPSNYKPTLADGIAADFTPTRGAYELVKETLDEVVIVSEAEIARSVRLLALENKLVAEGAGATGLAAALAVPRKERGRSVCIISGGSIDAGKLAHILEEN